MPVRLKVILKVKVEVALAPGTSLKPPGSRFEDRYFRFRDKALSLNP